jgi:hypothetical protein
MHRESADGPSIVLTSEKDVADSISFSPANSNLLIISEEKETLHTYSMDRCSPGFFPPSCYYTVSHFPKFNAVYFSPKFNVVVRWSLEFF